MTIIQIKDTSDPTFDLLRVRHGLSFFEPYLQHFTKETIETEGEAFLYVQPLDPISGGIHRDYLLGLFLYDPSERTGSIFTKSRTIFDYFYHLRPLDSIFSELGVDLNGQAYDIFTTDLPNTRLECRFRHEILVVGADRNPPSDTVNELEKFMESTNPLINSKWVKTALRNGEQCFHIRIHDQIQAVGWASCVNGIGRLHSLYVERRFRNMGLGQDLVNARLIWLKAQAAKSAFSEISWLNSTSARLAVRAGMRSDLLMFEYQKEQVKI